MAVAPDTGAVVAVDTRTGQPETVAAGPDRIRPISVATAGENALVLADDLSDSSAVPQVDLFNLRTLDPAGQSPLPPLPPRGQVDDVAVSGDGNWVAMATSGGGIWLAVLDRSNTVTFGIAASEERTAFYLGTGFGF